MVKLRKKNCQLITNIYSDRIFNHFIESGLYLNKNLVCINKQYS